MSSRKQLLVSGGIVGAALVVVIAYAAIGAPGKTPAGASGGHDHSAMAAGADAGPSPVRLTDDAARRIGITYAKATWRPLVRTVRAVGNVVYDETRIANVNPKIDGWVERLYVDFTGAPVRAGQPLLDVYSPMLVSAQEELLLARRMADRLQGAGDRAAANAREMLDAARRRLRYWDISDDEIRAIEESGTPRRTLTLRAPASGIVIAKNVVQGARIMPGMDLYTIADLSTVWVEGEVYEKDIAFARTGLHARITFEAFPGESFHGTVTYIHPTVAADSRTGRVRVEIANPDLRIRPGMYATIELEAAGDDDSLLVPRSAVLFTGERALVFMHHGDGLLVPHEVTTGHAAGDDIEILDGLPPGATVVASAAFLVDAEANLAGALQALPGAAAHAGHGAQSATDPHAGHAVQPAADPHAGHAGHTGH